MANPVAMTKQQKEWQAQDDAYALAAAEQIKKDPVRMKAAAQQAQKMQKDHMDRANAMKTVANKAPKTTIKQSTKKK